MNSLIIPPSPNWYEASILACACDNTLIYGARNDIVVIEDSPSEDSANVKIICRAHSQKIISVNINKNWGLPKKLFVTVAEDKIIKLWNAETMKKVLSHNEHIVHNKVIGATFAGDERIISVSDDGVIIVWNTSINQTNTLKDIFGSKVTVTCISTCPHASWLAAFGLKNGLVVVCDLRKQGKVLYKLRGHDKSVLSLAWCPVPVNIFPKDPRNYVGMKQVIENHSSTPVNVENDTADNYNYQKDTEIIKLLTADVSEVNGTQREKKHIKKDIWVNLKHIDDDEVSQDCKESDLLKVDDFGGDDFLKECDLLLKKITNLKVEDEKGAMNTVKSIDRVILKAKKNQHCKVVKDEPGMETKAGLTSPEITKGLERSQFVKLSEATVRDENGGYLDDTINKIYSAKETDELFGVEGIVAKEKPKDTNERMGNWVDADVLECDNVKGKTNESPERTDNREALDVRYNLIESPEDGKKCLDGEDQLKDDINKHVDSSVLDTEEIVLETMEIKDDNMDKENGISSEDGNESLDTSQDHLKDGVIKHVDSSVLDVEEIVLKTMEVKGDDMDEENGLSICKKEGEKRGRREIPRNIPVEEEPRKEFLLASSAREENIYIWRAGTDGRMQTFFNVSNSSNHRKSRRSYSDKLWITLCWVTPTMLLTSSKSGELIQWMLPKPKDNSKPFRLIHNDHSSILFSIAAPVMILNEHNWFNETNSNAWTVGQDRLLLSTSLGSDRKNLACYPTLGRVECLTLSPLDPTRLAIGTLEGVVKIWDLSRPHLKCIFMNNFYQKIQSKVVALAWHPTNELLLAYGTLEGRIGYLDIRNKSKMPTVMLNFFKTQIHNIEWGPVNGDKQNLGLFAAGEGKLVVFNTKSSEKEPIEVDTPDNTYVYNFAWKPDYTMMVVSTKTGTVIVYSTELKIIATHYFQYKVQSIFWHPDAAVTNSGSSKYSCCFAAISGSKEVNVYNFASESHKDELVMATYESNGDIISSAAWSPHESSKLVVASEGITQVWDVELNTILSTFINPNFEGSTCVVWSPLDPDFIISASKDHTIRIWKVSDYPMKTKTEISELRKKVVEKGSDECTNLLPKLERTVEEPQKLKKSGKNNLLPRFYSSKDTAQTVNDLRQLLSWKEGLGNGEVGETDNKSDILKVFGTSADMLNIVDLNQTVHKERGKCKLGNTLSLFKGDISTTIKEAVDAERVDPWIIMMAPLISANLWRRACEIYAVQLSQEADSDPLEVATYYLACHKVQEALNALCEGGMYREALALAKCRLLESDATIMEIIEKWGKYSLAVGNFEAAAQCYIFLGNYEQAASVLFRRCDVDVLEFAMELAKRSGNEDLHKAVQFRYDAFKSAREDNDVKDELPHKVEAFLREQQQENSVLQSESIEAEEEDHSKENGIII